MLNKLVRKSFCLVLVTACLLPFGGCGSEHNTDDTRNAKSVAVEPKERPVAQPVKKQESYVGNAKTKKFHRATCSVLKRTNSNNLVILHSREEAAQKGYKPCGKCIP